MTINKENEPQKPIEKAVVLKVSINQKLYARLLSFKKERGLKDSSICIMAIDELLTKNNF
jgi:hypothetical protein